MFEKNKFKLNEFELELIEWIDIIMDELCTSIIRYTINPLDLQWIFINWGISPSYFSSFRNFVWKNVFKGLRLCLSDCVVPCPPTTAQSQLTFQFYNYLIGTGGGRPRESGRFIWMLGCDWEGVWIRLWEIGLRQLCSTNPAIRNGVNWSHFRQP